MARMTQTNTNKNKGLVQHRFFYKKSGAGFSLVEMLIYTGIMALFLIASVNASIIMLGAYGRARASKLLNTAAVELLNKIDTESQKATSVDAVASILGTSPGKLVLDQSTGSGTQKAEFSVVDGRVLFKRGGVALGNITPAGTTVDNLLFYKIEQSGRQAVRLIVALRAEKGGNTKTETFYLTTALRGSY